MSAVPAHAHAAERAGHAFFRVSTLAEEPVDWPPRRTASSGWRARMLITAAEAAEILGIGLQTVYDFAARGVLTRHAPSHVRRAYDHVEIEARSLARLKRYHHEPHPYWATSEEAAAM